MNRTAEGLEKVLKEKLQSFKLENKLMAQTYNGVAVMSGAEFGGPDQVCNVLLQVSRENGGSGRSVRQKDSCTGTNKVEF